MIFGTCDTDGQAVQLLDRFCLGGIGEKILALQHGAIVFDNILDQLCDIRAGLVSDESLCVDFSQFHFQNIVHSIRSRLFVIDLAGGAGKGIADGIHPVVAVAVEEFHELQYIGDQEIGLHFFQMGIIIEAFHTGQPFRLLQDEDFGMIDTCACQHSRQREGTLLFFKICKCTGVVAADGSVLGV